jgi:serine/threonine-protein kinase
MAEVWRARHVALNSSVAIKFLRGASAHASSTRKRFTKEAQVTAQLKTRHAVQVFDFGITDEGLPYLVMELLDGETLGHRIARQKTIPVETTVRFLSQAARALDRAHALGIVHRDFKPDNIVVTFDEEGKEYIKVLDFGVAKLLRDLEPESAEPPRSEPPTANPAETLSAFTRTGALLGTPYYMAPEQILNAPDLDLRADIWAFGVVAFECLTGEQPFVGKNLVDLFARINSGDHRPAQKMNPALPASFEEWFEIACATSPAKRFGSAKEAAQALAVALEQSTSPRISSAPSIGAQRVVLGPADGSGSHAMTVETDGTPRLAVHTPDSKEPETANAATTSPPSAATMSDSVVPLRTPDRVRGRRIAVLAAMAGVLALAMWRTAVAPDPDAPRARSAVAPSVLPAVEPPVALAPPPAASSSPAPVASIAITVKTTPEGALLYFDGERAPNPLVRRAALDGTTHTLRAEAPGREPQIESLVLDGDKTIALVLKPEAPRSTAKGAPRASTSAAASPVPVAPPPPSAPPASPSVDKAPKPAGLGKIDTQNPFQNQ